MSVASSAEPDLSPAAARALPALDRSALIAVLLLPLLLMHAHGIAEVAIGIADACFLARAAITRDWAWLRTPWLQVGLLWWGWIALCSVPLPQLGLGEYGLASLAQGVANVRFLILVAAMEHVILRDPGPRRWLYGIIAASAAYIALQSLIQFVFGRNLYGNPSSWGITLTGPFGKPRAGPPLSRILLPVIVPPAVALLNRRRWGATLAAVALVVASVVIMVLINQRMPLVLLGFGMLIAGLLVKRLRPLVLGAGLAGLLLVAASMVASPAIYNRLVGLTSHQMLNFPSSPYGEIYTRALAIGLQKPITGAGADGFRYACPQPRFFHATLDGVKPDGGGAEICANHPHNPFMEALVNGGFVGLALFCWLAIAWLIPLGRGLWRNPEPLRVGLFAAAVLQLWPIASTSGFTSMPMGGWFFLLLGWGMAEARWQAAPDGARTR